MSQYVAKDITGEKHHRLTAIERTDRRTSSGAYYWKWQCECGNTIVATPHTIRTGMTKSCGCYKREMCREHLSRTRRLRKPPPKNPVRFEGDVAILTTNGKNKIDFVVDRDDYDLIKDYKWYPGGHGYIVSTVENNKHVFLHRLLCPSDLVHTDHIDGNIYNNRKSNLRPATHSDNFGNRRKQSCYAGKPTSSIYKGVCYSEKENVYKVSVSKYNKVVYRGTFSDELEAAAAYNRVASEVFGSFARLNILPE